VTPNGRPLFYSEWRKAAAFMLLAHKDMLREDKINKKAMITARECGMLKADDYCTERMMNMFERAKAQTFISRVFLHMTWALVLTGFTALGVASYPPFLYAVATNPFGVLILAILEIALVVYLSRRALELSVGAAYLGMAAFAVINGVTLSVIFLVYTARSVFLVFFASAALFLVTSAFGYVTKRDLSAAGRFLFMTLVGLILMSLLNFIFRSEAVMYLYSAVSVFVFSGLTAYDTQLLRRLYEFTELDGEQYEKLAIVGALRLYLDLINIFLSLLRLFGRRR